MSAEATLRASADRFHAIISAMLLARGVANETVRAKLEENVLDDEDIAETCAIGFEACVLEVRAMGAADVTIHECSEEDITP